MSRRVFRVLVLAVVAAGGCSGDESGGDASPEAGVPGEEGLGDPCRPRLQRRHDRPVSSDLCRCLP